MVELIFFQKAYGKQSIDVEKATANYDNIFLNFAFAYGGRAEILDAAKIIAGQVKDGKLELDDINESIV